MEAQTLELDLADLEIEEITPVELNEESKGHAENLASTFFCCCSTSSVMLA